MDTHAIYCTSCAQQNPPSYAFCIGCGRSRLIPPAELTGHLGFVLNELTSWPLIEIATEHQRTMLNAHYRDQLERTLGPAPAPQRAPEPAPVAAVPAQAAPFQRPQAGQRLVAAPPRRAGPPPPPSAPAPSRIAPDWSWVAEQQANLLLFAGAFLTVVAALIYVGYSEQAVDGALKMTLLVAYTLAFVAGGVGCLRIPRVEMAGRAFFGVGALLVPMNFVAAYNIYNEQDLSAESMWLAGSIVTAMFYFAVAWLGLGRLYSVGAAAATISATVAGVVVGDVQLAWAPIIFIAAAGAMLAPWLVGTATLRERLGEIWFVASQAVAVPAMIFAAGLSPFVFDPQNEWEVASRWYLPATFAAFALYAAIPAAKTRRPQFGAAAIAGVAGAAMSLLYATDAPAETYAAGFATLALAAALTMHFLARPDVTERLPERAFDALRFAGIGATVAAAVSAFIVLQMAEREIDPYIIEHRWMFAVAAALAAVFYVYEAFVRSERLGVAGTAIATTAFGAATVHALELSPEYLAFAFVLPAVTLAAGVRFGANTPVASRLHAAWTDDSTIAAYVGAIVASSIAWIAVLTAAPEESTFDLASRWFLPPAMALAALTFALDSSRGSRAGVNATALAAFGIAASLVYAFDISPEYYAFAFAIPALMMAVAVRFATNAPGAKLLDPAWPEDAMMLGYAGAVAASAIAGGTVVATADEGATYALQTNWSLAPLMAMVTAVFALDASRGERAGIAASALGTVGFAAALVYALDVSPEYYAFAFAVPALLFAAAVRFSTRITAAVRLLHPEWAADATMLAYAGALAGVAVGAVAVLVSIDAEFTYDPQTRWFLAPLLALVAATFALDASRERRAETTAATLVALVIASFSIPYALEAGSAWYGVALCASGLALALGGRAWTPEWIDGGVRDATGAIAVALATLPFEFAYLDEPRIGAGVHLGAAALFGLAALFASHQRTVGQMLGIPDGPEIRLNVAWLYAAAFSAVAGYLFVLRAMAGDDVTESGSVALPLMAAALASIALALYAARVRPEFHVHLYVVSLLVAVAAIAAAPDAQTLAVVLTAFIGAYAFAAALDDEPLMGVPAAVFGLAAVFAWREQLNANAATVPVNYVVVAVFAYAVAVWLRKSAPKWSNALRALGAAYGLIAPVAGLALIAYESDAETAAAIQSSALYQWTTLAVAMAGVLALIESSLSGRRWIIVPATAVMTAAVLLQINRFDPESIQPYAITVGLYLVLLGVLGLGRFRLIPDLADASVFVEAAGAAIIMLPSGISALDDGGWRYTVVLIAEATAFLSASVALRRRGLLVAALGALVLVALHALFDAVNAMPNWIVVMLAGMALLAGGSGILAGRDRWTRWQEQVLRWWEETGGEALIR